MERTAALLAERGKATFRYQLPYMEEGKKRPDRQPLLLATVRAAVDELGASRAITASPCASV